MFNNKRTNFVFFDMYYCSMY